MQMMLGSGECIASENNTALLPDSQFTAKANRLVSRDLRCGPVSAVNWRKQRELCRSAKVWMSRFEKPGDTFRFDVIGVILGQENIRVQHVENAFLIRSKT